MDGRIHSVLPNSLYDHHQLQNRSGGDCWLQFDPEHDLGEFRRGSRAKGLFQALYEFGHLVRRIDNSCDDHSNTGCMVDGLFAHQAHQRYPYVDAIDEDDASRGCVGAYLPSL